MAERGQLVAGQLESAGEASGDDLVAVLFVFGLEEFEFGGKVAVDVVIVRVGILPARVDVPAALGFGRNGTSEPVWGILRMTETLTCVLLQGAVTEEEPRFQHGPIHSPPRQKERTACQTAMPSLSKHWARTLPNLRWIGPGPQGQRSKWSPAVWPL